VQLPQSNIADAGLDCGEMPDGRIAQTAEPTADITEEERHAGDSMETRVR